MQLSEGGIICTSADTSTVQNEHFVVARLVSGNTQRYTICITGHLVCFPRIPMSDRALYRTFPISDHSDNGAKGRQSDIISDVGLTFLEMFDIRPMVLVMVMVLV
jgi:hypothetical protein